MKKLFAFLLVIGFVSASIAEEAKKDAQTAEPKKDYPLKVSVSGIVYGTNYNTVAKDVNGDFSAFRIRPLFNFTDGNIEAVLQLEYDAVFGQNNYKGSGTDSTVYDETTNKSSENVGIGSDKKGLEVAKAYIKSKVDGFKPLTIIAGIADYDYPLIWGDNAPLAGINITTENVILNFYYLKPSEGTLNDSKDDAQIYIADFTFKLGDSSIRPAFFAYECKENAKLDENTSLQFRDSIGYIYALTFNLNFGTFGMDTTGVYIRGEDKINDVQYSAYACDVAPYLRPSDNLKFTAFFTIISGDSDHNGGDSFLNATIDGKGDSGINNWRLFMIEDGGSFTTNSDVTNTGKYTNTNGYLAYGLSLTFTLGPVTTKLQSAYIMASETATGQKSDMGFEFDGNIGFALTKSSTLYIEGAYLKAGKFYETTDTTTGVAGTVEMQNPYYVNVGMTYSL
jgi:hypothetical protein